MEAIKGLPTFFQTSTTVLDELANFDIDGEEAGNLNTDDLLDSLIGDQKGDEALNEETFADNFGDLKAEDLPSYFVTPSGRNMSRSLAADEEGDDMDLADLLSRSTAERLKDQAEEQAAQRAQEESRSASKPFFLTPGGGTAVRIANPFASPASKATPGTASKSAPLLPPGLTPSKSTPPTPAGAVPPPGMPALAPSNQVQAPAMPELKPNFPGLLPTSTPGAPLPPLLANPAQNTGNQASKNSSSVVATLLASPQPMNGMKPQFATPSKAAPQQAPLESGASTPSSEQKQFFTPKPNYGRGQYMSTSDVRFVISKVLQPLETMDPYADDFYFLQHSIKKNAKDREKALNESKPTPRPINVPLPTWKETKERIAAQINQSRSALKEKTREWEAKEGVLGHRLRSEISRPKELLSLPALSELDFDINEDDDVEMKTPFSSRLWSTRLAVQRGYEALFTVQELQYLLSSPLIASNAIAIEEIRREIESAIQVLADSLGIRTIYSDPFSLMSLDGSTNSNNANIQLDGRHIAAILQTAMGKKLLSRGLKLLNPNQRWALIPVVLAKLLMTPNSASTLPSAAPSSSSGANTTDSNANNAGISEAVEKRLLKTIIEYLQYSYQVYLNLQKQPSLSATIPEAKEGIESFCKELLSRLRQVLKNILITQLPYDTSSGAGQGQGSHGQRLRDALLVERTRAEVVHVVVSLGNEILSQVARISGQTAEEWVQTRDAFMSFLDN